MAERNNKTLEVWAWRQIRDPSRFAENTPTQHKFVRGGISVAAVTVVCFDLTIEKMEAEGAEHNAIILNVAKIMHHIFRCRRISGLIHVSESN